MIKRIAITPGEPAGIGPDIVLMAAQFQWPFELVAIAEMHLLQTRAVALNMNIQFHAFNPENPRQTSKPNTLTVLDTPLKSPVVAGTLNKENAPYVLETLDIAISGALKGSFDALITGPVHKGIMNDANIAFSGHTEYLRDQCNVNKVVMLMASDKMNVALATTHVPLTEVSRHITQTGLLEVISIIDQHWRHYYQKPAKIFVSGLNPHAGENGHIGREEIDVIEPACQQAQIQGYNITGPFSADTLFLEECDVFLVMYHDQGLPVFKYASFGKAANITMGLPFIRVSVDHGTALDLAGTGQAKANSLIYALKYAEKLLEKLPQKDLILH